MTCVIPEVAGTCVMSEIINVVTRRKIHVFLGEDGKNM